MGKIIAKILVVMFIVFFGITNVSASYRAVPVIQYRSANGFYSDWYLKYRNELDKKDNGKLYGGKYQKHFTLWRQVEGLTTEQVNRNPNKILTVPVSGALAERASFYSVLSDDGTVVPQSVVIGEKTYTKSAEREAEKLYTVTATQQVAIASVATNNPNETVTPQKVENTVVTASFQPLVPALVSVADIRAERQIIREEWRLMSPETVIIVLLIGVLTYVVITNRQLKKVIESQDEILRDGAVRSVELGVLFRKHFGENAMKQNETEEVLEEHLQPFILEDEDLLSAVNRASMFIIHGGNKIYLPIVSAGKEVLINSVHVKRINKNIFVALKTAHKEYLEDSSLGHGR